MKKLFSLCLFVGLLTACQQDTSNNDSNKNARENSEFSKKLETVQVLVTRESQNARVTFETAPDVKIYEINRFSLDSAETLPVRGVSDELVSELYDLSPWRFVYEVKTSRGDFHLEVEVRKNLIVDRKIHVNELSFDSNLLKLESLRIQPGGELITGGLDILIDAKEAHFEDGSVMSTFSEEEVLTPPPFKQEGRSGGHIRVKAKKAEGLLRVFMKGALGGQGEPGAATAENIVGTPGEVGPSESSRAWRHPDGFERVCLRGPGDGKKGGKGHQGGKGLRGLPGGDAGRFTFEVESDALLTLEVFQIPGPGGRGGDGGIGGRGGPGGPPGKSGHCEGGAKQGPEGDRGDQGPQGDIGPSGRLGTACLISPTKNHCEKVPEIRLELK